MSFIPQPAGSSMVFKPVRRNSTVRRPLPVPPPAIPPGVPSYPARSLYPRINGHINLSRSFKETAPCAKIIVEEAQKTDTTCPIGDRNFHGRSRARNITQTKTDEKPFLRSEAIRNRSEDACCNIHVTNSSTIILNHVDPSTINKQDLSLGNRHKRVKNRQPKRKLDVTKALQIFTKYEENIPKISAASVLFRSLRVPELYSSQKGVCAFDKYIHGCETNDGAKVLPISTTSIYEIQEICLWLSDDGDYATEQDFYSLIGIYFMIGTY